MKIASHSLSSEENIDIDDDFEQDEVKNKVNDRSVLSREKHKIRIDSGGANFISTTSNIDLLSLSPRSTDGYNRTQLVERLQKSLNKQFSEPHSDKKSEDIFDEDPTSSVEEENSAQDINYTHKLTRENLHRLVKKSKEKPPPMSMKKVISIV